jgi:V/A-type H+-transporting ATPase subunit D
MPRLKVSPTRSSLLMVRQRLDLARQGHRLLESKRDVLMLEIMRLIEDAERVQREAQARFERAYGAIEEARVAEGTERLRRFALAQPHGVELRITPRSVMGVVVPSVTYQVPPRRPLFGFGNSSVMLDQAELAWADVLDVIGELAEKVTTVWRLALELRRTQRRVNALENIFIPNYEETVDYIEDTLEEKDREELFRAKRAAGRSAEGASAADRSVGAAPGVRMTGSGG